MVGLLASSQSDKYHVFPASLLNLPGGDKSPGIARQDDLQEKLGIIGGASCLIIAVFLLETRSVQPGSHQFMNGELQGSGQQLIFQGHWQEHPLAIIVRLELGRGPLCKEILLTAGSTLAQNNRKL